MANFVIVHGGWGGGWEWRQVAAALRRSGHDVETPTLTGLGDRAHLATRAVGLATHVEDIVATITSLDLAEVILVGQSYGGMVVTGVADRIPARIGRVVYLDAFVPTHGVSCNDLCGEAWTTRVRELAVERGDGWRVPMPFSGNLGLSDEVARWYIPRLVPQPLATLDDPAELHGRGTHLPHSFVRCLNHAGEEQADPISDSARRAREAGWDYREVVAPHDLHVEDPTRMAALLGDIAV